MAAPAVTARVTPVGIKLKDGFSCKIAFAADPDVSFWEKTVKPPGVDGGDSVEQTTMHNLVYRTMAPRLLKTMTESSCKAAYDPAVYVQIVQLINVETAITFHYPDGTTLSIFGYLKGFEVDDLAEGTQPEATVTIVPTNYDPVNNVEAGPNLVNVPGT